MPRLHQVPRDEARATIVTTMYDMLFGERDPVAEPGTATGTPGRLVDGVRQLARRAPARRAGLRPLPSPKRVLDRVLRELGQTRAGWAAREPVRVLAALQVAPGARGQRGADRRDRRTGRRGRASRELERSCSRTPTAWCYDRAGCPTRCSSELREPPLRRRDAGADVHHHALPPARRDVAGAADRVRRRRRAGGRGRRARGLRGQGHRARHSGPPDRRTPYVLRGDSVQESLAPRAGPSRPGAATPLRCSPGTRRRRHGSSGRSERGRSSG